MFFDESNKLETYTYVKTKKMNKFEKFKSLRGPAYLIHIFIYIYIYIVGYLMPNPLYTYILTIYDLV